MTVPSTYAVLRVHERKQAAEVAIAKARKEWEEQRQAYEKEWREVFERSLADSGLFPCTYCCRICLASSLQERWSLYSKSDNYGPVFAHTATKHSACSECAEKLASPREAKKFDAMFEVDDSKRIPDKAIEALIPLLNLSPREPWTL
ncbi:MAG: hypothetical protein KGL39_24975 [Patescibacteria group bacterium]|nr:hypothetical protein [Patescibacteria group bacterium]